MCINVLYHLNLLLWWLKRAVATKGFSDGGIIYCHRISILASAIWGTCSGDSIIAMGMPDEGSCRIVVGGSIHSRQGWNQTGCGYWCTVTGSGVEVHKYQRWLHFMSLECLNCFGYFVPLQTRRKKLNTCSKRTAASLISKMKFCLICSLFMHRRCDPYSVVWHSLQSSVNSCTGLT